MREAMWYKREFICENRVRYPVTLGSVDVDVRLQPAAQPAAQPLDPAAAESGHADRHPSLASPTRSMRAQTRSSYVRTSILRLTVGSVQ